MKKIILVFLFVVIALPVLALTGLVLSWSSFLEPKVRDSIHKNLNHQGYNLQMSPIEVQSWIPPFQIQLSRILVQSHDEQLQMKLDQAKAKVKIKSIGFSPSDFSLAVWIQAQKPQLFLNLDEKKSTDKPGEDKQRPLRQEKEGGLPEIALDFIIKEGVISLSQTGEAQENKSGQVWLTALEARMTAAKLFSPSAMQVKISGQMGYDYPTAFMPIRGAVPFQINSEKIVLNKSELQIEDLTANLGGLDFSLKGFGDFKNGTQEWNAILKADDIKSLSQAGLLPQGKWSGYVHTKLGARLEKDKPLRVEGSVVLKDLKGRLSKAIQADDAQIAGSFNLTSSAKFHFQEKLTLHHFDLFANLRQMDIYKKDLFRKARGVPLILNGKGRSAQNKFQIDQLQAELGDLRANIKGVVAAKEGSVSEIYFDLPKTNLKGMEEMFLPLKSYPVEGSLAVKASIKGDLQDLEKLEITANPLNLNIKSGIEYKNKEKEIELLGPFGLGLQGLLKVKGHDLVSGNLKGQAEFSKMKMQWNDTFSKKAGERLKMVFQGSKQKNSFLLKSFNLATFFGEISATGTIADPLKPRFDLNSQIKGVTLGKLKPVAAGLQDLPLTGTVNGKLALRGHFDSDLGVQKSPITINGNISHIAKSLTWTSVEKSKEINEKNAKPVEKEEAKPLLPEWPLFKKSKIRFQSRIENLNFNGLKASGVGLNAQVDRGQLKGEFSVKRVFSGEIQFKNMTADLYKVPTFILGTAAVKGLALQPAVAWAFPEHEKLLKGSLTGGFHVKTPFPGHADVLQNSKTKGDLNISGFELSTLKLDQMANDLLAKVPGLKSKKMKSGGVKAIFRSQYSFNQGQLKFTKTNFLTPENNQLLASGSVDLDKQLYLKGRLFIAGINVDQEIKTCLLDKQGRLEIPVEYKGLITEPKMTFALKAVEGVGKKYLKCEGQKEIKKAKAKIKKKVDAEVDKSKKKLEQNLKDKLKDIF